MNRGLSCLVAVWLATSAAQAQETTAPETATAQAVEPTSEPAASEAEPGADGDAAALEPPSQATDIAPVTAEPARAEAEPAPTAAAESPPSPAPARPAALNLSLPGAWSSEADYRLPTARTQPQATKGKAVPAVGDRTLAADRARSQDADLRPITPGAPERPPVLRVKRKF